ncbi:MAG: hypothetical protein ABI422_05685 [Sphingomicrobium sp.]
MIDAADGEGDDEAEDTPKTITLSDRELQAAAHLLNVIMGLEDDRGQEMTRMAQANVPMASNLDRTFLVEAARQTFVSRTRRRRYFNSAMFGEAAWDMLLALYVTEQSGARHTVTGLTSLSAVPSTTALRWLKFLEEEELVIRMANPLDGRVSLIKLNSKARAALDAYFSGTAPPVM